MTAGRRFVLLAPLFLLFSLVHLDLDRAEACESHQEQAAAAAGERSPGVPDWLGGPVEGPAAVWCQPLPDSTRAHGITSMGAVAQMFMELEPIYPRAGTLWRGALDWMEIHSHPGNPGVEWLALEQVPDSCTDYARSTTAWNAMAFAEGWLRSNDPDHLAMATGAIDWLVSQEVPIPGPAVDCVFIEPFPHPHTFNLGAYNMGAVGRGALEVFRITADPDAEGVARCVAEAYKTLAVPDSASGGYKWHVFGMSGGFVTAFCSGAAGMSEFLIEMSATFPGEWYESYARGALAWLASIAVEDLHRARQRLL